MSGVKNVSLYIARTYRKGVTSHRIERVCDGQLLILVPEKSSSLKCPPSSPPRPINKAFFPLPFVLPLPLLLTELSVDPSPVSDPRRLDTYRHKRMKHGDMMIWKGCVESMEKGCDAM